MKERFERCLDLYLAARTIKDRIHINPDQLLPELPDPKELKPFPNLQISTFIGHTSRIRTISVDKTGAFLLSGSEDGVLILWETMTNRIVNKWNFEVNKLK